MKLIAITPLKVGGKRIEEGKPFDGDQSFIDNGLAVTSSEAKQAEEDEAEAEAKARKKAGK